METLKLFNIQSCGEIKTFQFHILQVINKKSIKRTDYDLTIKILTTKFVSSVVVWKSQGPFLPK